jgi:hypothetical protein
MEDLSRSNLGNLDVVLAATSQRVVEDTMERHPSLAWRRHIKFIPQGFPPDSIPEFLR